MSRASIRCKRSCSRSHQVVGLLAGLMWLTGAYATATAAVRKAVEIITPGGIKVWLRAFIDGLRVRIAQVLAEAGLDASNAALFHTMLVGAAILNVARDDDASRRETRSTTRAAVELLA